jgi:hypothetical protein
MILFELFEKVPGAYQDVAQDNSQPTKDSLRKTRLTLNQISRLRQMNDLRTYEFKEKIKKVKKQYSPPPAPMA